MKKEIKIVINDFVTETRSLLKENLVGQYLFGSYSQNKQTTHSDIDILIIVKSYEKHIRRQISALSSSYSLDRGIVISPIIKDVVIWEKNKKYNTQLYKEIIKNGILL
ncbi:nucleotidyltransferase domain-containing protein [candidate division KSB1 bacterium]|nr:nucleotidyltransferase domain-containing protein [candidate division KSB1 bacterium]